MARADRCGAVVAIFGVPVCGGQVMRRYCRSRATDAQETVTSKGT